MNLTTDTLRSFVAALGDPLRDKAATAFYGNVWLTDEQLSTSYRTSWIAKKIVDIPAFDALRKWRLWQGDKKAITQIEAEERRLGLQTKMLACKTLARLWGGAAIIIGEKGIDDLTTPYDPEKVKKGGLPYLTVLSRREISSKELDNDPLSEFFGKPILYEVTGQERFVELHPSRLVVQIGSPHPDPWNAIGSANGWGDSVLQSAYDAMTHADSTSANIASLVFEANVDVFGIPDLQDYLVTKESMQRLLDRFMLATVGKSINRAMIRDTAEEYERKDIKFNSLPDVLQQFLLVVSAAADIPLTRFLGQSPAGLNSTGSGDMKNYYDRVTSIQSLEIGPAMYLMDEALIRSALGSRPEDLFYLWAPLEQVNEVERATIGKTNAETTEILGRTGLFDPQELRDATINQLVENAIYPGLDEITAGNKVPEPEEPDPALEDPDPVIEDAAPRTLYVRRDVLNRSDFETWAKSQGIENLQPDLHVTIVYSRALVDWMKFGEAWSAEIKITGGARLMDKFNGGAKVLLFKSSELEWRHEQLVREGASRDYEPYQAHITVSYEDDIDNVEPYKGEIILGPEVWEEIKP